MIRRSYASDHAELREGMAALSRSGLTSVQGTILIEGAEKLLRQRDLIDTLVETLVWVRRHYGGGSTTEINARIDAAIAKAKAQGGGPP